GGGLEVVDLRLVALAKAAAEHEVAKDPLIEVPNAVLVAVVVILGPRAPRHACHQHAKAERGAPGGTLPLLAPARLHHGRPLNAALATSGVPPGDTGRNYGGDRGG